MTFIIRCMFTNSFDYADYAKNPWTVRSKGRNPQSPFHWFGREKGAKVARRERGRGCSCVNTLESR